MTPSARAEMFRGFARRLKALGAPIGDPDEINADDRSLLKILEGMLNRLEAQAAEHK